MKSYISILNKCTYLGQPRHCWFTVDLPIYHRSSDVTVPPQKDSIDIFLLSVDPMDYLGNNHCDNQRVKICADVRGVNENLQPIEELENLDAIHKPTFL